MGLFDVAWFYVIVLLDVILTYLFVNTLTRWPVC